MTQEHPITPPPELVQQWWDGTHGALYEFEAVATQAARWGADQELEACCEWFLREGWNPEHPVNLRAARRPKPPSLKEQALAALNVIEDKMLGPTTEEKLIRQALEQLDD
jgi:hypothetical protein